MQSCKHWDKRRECIYECVCVSIDDVFGCLGNWNVEVQIERARENGRSQDNGIPQG